MLASLLKSFVAVGVSLVAAVPAYAQPLFGRAESIESTVVNADRVFIGRLVEFGEGRADEREGQEGTMGVEDVIKAEHFADEEPAQRLRVHLSYPAPVLASWKDHSHRLLVAVNGDDPKATRVIDLAPEGLAALTEDLTLLRDPDAVLRVAREVVRRTPAAVRRLHNFGLVVPRETVVGTKKWEEYYATGGWLVLNVPVDGRLEMRARDAIRSKDYLRREEGGRALRYFKSDENIVRVKALLDDPGWSYRHHPQENEGVEVRFYGVRQEAYRTLKSWGVSADRPITRKEVRN